MVSWGNVWGAGGGEGVHVTGVPLCSQWSRGSRWDGGGGGTASEQDTAAPESYMYAGRGDGGWGSG